MLGPASRSCRTAPHHHISSTHLTHSTEMCNTIIDPDHSLRSLARAEWLSFSGDPSEYVLLFAQAVHRFAFAHGRQKDNIWIADYAYGCLSGKALDWFEDLDHDIKQDWSSLRPAMITEF
ncbi:hypothetical protein FRB93_006816 [Tulasnella sp. JGI-2019a]|nr:hypothetical protein FRB93_006816 [Tulasnella sp. JGI-2019a]